MYMEETTYIQINPYHLVQTIGALRIEVRTGLRHSRGSVWKMAKEVYGLKGNKEAVLAQLEALKEEVDAQLGL